MVPNRKKIELHENVWFISFQPKDIPVRFIKRELVVPRNDFGAKVNGSDVDVRRHAGPNVVAEHLEKSVFSKNPLQRPKEAPVPGKENLTRAFPSRQPPPDFVTHALQSARKKNQNSSEEEIRFPDPPAIQRGREQPEPRPFAAGVGASQAAPKSIFDIGDSPPKRRSVMTSSAATKTFPAATTAKTSSVKSSTATSANAVALKATAAQFADLRPPIPLYQAPKPVSGKAREEKASSRIEVTSENLRRLISSGTAVNSNNCAKYSARGKEASAPSPQSAQAPPAKAGKKVVAAAKKVEAAAKKVEATAGKRLSAAPTALTRQSTRLASRKMTRNENLDDDDCYDLEGEV